MIDRFFVTGGTLRRDAACYVERRADAELYEGLRSGAYCYVLTSRQMGKSSLMVRTASRLQEDGIRVVALDLTAVGQNLTAEQWYYGLLEQLGERLDVEEELNDFWVEHERLGPLQRFMAALRDVVLVRVGQRFPTPNTQHPTPNLVIFVDEIDAVTSLPFSTDEFFAAIRECYNRRVDDPAFEPLTFCLLGVAAPTDLIRDARMTPFNIGRRVELTDFTVNEATPLRIGLEVGGPETPSRPAEQARRLLERVLHWTGGHPYLTQRLSEAVAEDRTARSPADVDRLCQALFLTSRARETDDNLVFVRQRLLSGNVDAAALLDLYRKVVSGKRIPDDAADPLVSELKLSGVVRAERGYLRLRNRIYERVFDARWIAANMPDAEVRRQRQAARRAMLRTSAVAAAVLSVVGGLSLNNAQLARKASAQSARYRTLLYAADMNLAGQAFRANNLRKAVDLLEAHKPEPGQPDDRGYEWRYLWGVTNGERLTLARQGPLSAARYSPDGTLIATAGSEEAVRIWDARSGALRQTLETGCEGDDALAFSPNGRLLATAGAGSSVLLWDTGTWQRRASLAGHKKRVLSLDFSADGRRLLSGSEDHTARLWEVSGGKSLSSLRTTGLQYAEWGEAQVVRFSPDGGYFAVLFKGDPGWIDVYRAADRKRLYQVMTDSSWIAFSPDGRLLATHQNDLSGRVQVVRTATGDDAAAFDTEGGSIYCGTFSPDGRTLALGSSDHRIGLFSLAGSGESRKPDRSFLAHGYPPESLAYSPDGKMLLTCSGDQTSKVWDLAALPGPAAIDTYRGGDQWWPGRTPKSRGGGTFDTGRGLGMAFTSDGNFLALGASYDRDRRTDREWYWLQFHEAQSGRLLNTVKITARAVGLAFSPDDRYLVVGHDDGELSLWDARTRTRLRRIGKEEDMIWCVRYTPDGSKLLVGNDDGSLGVWDTATWKLASRWTVGEAPLLDIACARDNRTVALTQYDEVSLWDLGSRARTHTFHRFDSPVLSLAFSPDGRYLAVAGEEGRTSLWDVARRTLWKVLVDRGATTTGVSFAPDGRTLAVGSDDHTMRLWSLAAGQEVYTIQGASVLFSPDGRHLASTHRTGAAIWHAPSFDEIER
jgi:WD40 repeat protein